MTLARQVRKSRRAIGLTPREPRVFQWYAASAATNG